MPPLLDELRAAIDASGEPPSRVAAGAGIDRSQLTRFVRGERGLSVETAEAVAEYLGLRIELRGRRKTRKDK